ncbi:AMP-binding protein [Paenibacillus pabuli]|uniref:AMP-binding protein n=1 Tax=Paenibacillus pabuli TaxID=1472 RepID=UPI0007834B6A|nr:AMP-binding protein [Paenibacillus pabuli]MEC0128816.1 AMP-binding protein [Paenibacillus pabuli]
MFSTLNEALCRHTELEERGITFVEGEFQSEFCNFAELYQSSMSAVHLLRKNGVSEGSEVILQLDNTRDFLVIFWACLLGGIIPVPLTVSKNEEALAKTLRVTGVLKHPFIVAESRHLAELRERLSCFPDRNCVLLDVKNLMNQTVEHHEKPVLARPDDIAFIQFSSGTTGEPKGIKLTHRKLLANIYDLEERLGASSEDAFLNWMPLTHDLGMIMFHLLPLVAGLNQYQMPTWLFIRRPVLWLQLASQFKATMLASPNFGIKYFLNAYHKAANQRYFDLDLSRIKAVVNGAEPIDVEACQQFLDEMAIYGLDGKTMKMGYGMAEACVAVCIQEQHEAFTTYYVRRDSLNVGDQAHFLSSEDEAGLALSGTGTPLRSSQVRVCDDSGRTLPKGYVGFIQIKGANITDGYYNNEEATNNLFTPDGWAHTGDLGFLINNHLVFTGRTKDIIIINGSNYYPYDIERIAEECTDLKIKRMIACGIYREDTGTEEAALFVLYRDKLEEFGRYADQIRRHVNQVMGIHLSVILPISKIHQTTSGKLQRYKYIEKYKEGAFRNVEDELTKWEELREQEVLVQRPEDKTQQALFDIWCKLLGKKHVGVNDSFFEIGGTSILVMQMLEEVDLLYPDVITLTDIFAYPSVAQLAQLISGSQELPRKKLQLQAVQLEAPYFEAVWSGAENQYRMAVDPAQRSRFQTLCLELQIAEEAIWLALLSNAMYDISIDSKVTVHTMMDGKGWIVPFNVDFAEVERIEDLLLLAGVKKKVGEAEVYHKRDIEKYVPRIEPGYARCLFVRKGWLHTEDALHGVFDMIMEWQDMTDSVELFFRYNPSRMNGVLMKGLFQTIADSLESLLSVDIVSNRSVSQ